MSRADRRAGRCLLAIVAAALFTLPTLAKAQPSRSKQEEQRRKLLEEMGLKKSETPPAPPPAPAVPESEAPAEEIPGKGDKGQAARPVAAGPSFRRAIHPLLMQTCKVCHTPGGPAQATALVLTGDAGVDYAAARRVADVHAPAASAMLAKASGQKLHAGGAPWAVGGPAYARVLAWIQGGARLDGGKAPAPVAAAPTTGKPARKERPSAAGEANATPPTPGAVSGAEGPGAAATPPPPGQAPAPEEAAEDHGAPAPATDDFSANVHPLLVRTCAGCHSPVGYAAGTRLVLSGEVAADHAKIRPLVDPAAGAASLLLTKATGEMHGGGPVLKRDSAEYAMLLGWVSAGAQERPALQPGLPPPATGTAVPSAPAIAVAPAPVVAAAPTSPHHGAGGVGLPMGLMLNGRFDLNYERRNFTGSPFDDGATNALRSYHHFLFLSRESADDPLGLSLEVLSLQFWEVHYRWRAEHVPVHVLVSGGKIFVPFGADPLMHQSYGGLAGFDQKILPAIWAQEGGAVHLTFVRRELAITDDLYAVHGYALRQADGVLNLQNDFSPADDVKIGWGNRLGAAFGPLSAWYSVYYNRLGFGRRLLMQAADVMLWRMRQVPVLGHFSFAAGLLRADVSGGDDQGVGDPGQDYYHFGSYFQLRYHPTDWLIVQYRQGLRTFNNRRGMIVDDTRLTSDDASAHNFGVMARCRGVTAGLFWFVNLEKGPEIPDDFFRASVSYDF